MRSAHQQASSRIVARPLSQVMMSPASYSSCVEQGQAAIDIGYDGQNATARWAPARCQS